MNRNVYFAIENLGLTDPQRDQLWQAMQGLGVFNNSSLPNQRNHWRIRLDGQAAIHEAVFDEDKISIAAIKTWLANTFGVGVETIDHAVLNWDFSGNLQMTSIVTFSHNATDYIRMAIMGYTSGNWPTWEQSRVETVAYIKANDAEWNEPVV